MRNIWGLVRSGRHYPGLETGILGLVALAIAVFAPNLAWAKYDACNETSYIIRVAIAGKESGKFFSKGWSVVYPGQCTTVYDKPLSDSTYYIHGRSVIGHQGPMRHWAGNVSFCIAQSDDFRVEGDDRCTKRGYSEAFFDAVEVKRSKTWQTIFTEPAGHNKKKAGIMGVQRLLADLGYMRANRIDGYAGPGTRRAIRKFEREQKIDVPNEPSNELFNALLKAIREKASATGFEICNKSKNAVWAAIGIPLDKKVNTKGWYELLPDQCVKPILKKLSKDYMYVYAETNDTSIKKSYWRGNKTLCANDIIFSLTAAEGQCDNEGFKALKFRKIDTEGREKWTHFITDETSTNDGPF